MDTDKEIELEKSISKLPRIPLAARPTPLQPLKRLSKKLGGPLIYIKRDDLTGLAFGGNKTRMLEFSLGDAISTGADSVVVGAAVQSNYCRQLAAACAQVGLELYLILRPIRSIDNQKIQGNHLLDRLLGAKIKIIDQNDRALQQSTIAEQIKQLQEAGKRVYVPWQKDNIDLEAIAYVETSMEIVRQCREIGLRPEQLYVASFDITQAGLVLGLKYLKSSIHVRGFCPLADEPERTKKLSIVANNAAFRLGLEMELQDSDFDNDDIFAGEGYGIPTTAGMQALRMMARTEGILLDPVYTSKAMAGLIAHIREGRLSASIPVIFLHTGGAPAIFGYAEEVLRVCQA